VLSYVVFLPLLQDIDSPVPSIVEIHGSWALHFDNVQLLQQPAATFADVLQAWFASFWIFSVQYPQTLMNTCVFLERYCTENKTPVPGVVRRLAEKIVQ
jgi:hypothetical protein